MSMSTVKEVTLSHSEYYNRRILLEPIYIYRGYISPVAAVTVTATLPNGRISVITGDVNGGVKVLDVILLEVLGEIDLGVGILGLLVVDGCLWIHTRNGQVQCYTLNLKEKLNEFKCGDYSFCGIRGITMGKNHHQLVAVPSLTVTPDGIDIWSLDPLKLITSITPLSSTPPPTTATVEEKAGSVMCIRLFPNGEDDLRILAGFDDGTLRMFNVNIVTGESKPMFRIKIFPMTVTCVDYDMGTDTVVAGGPQTDLVIIRDISSNDGGGEAKLFRVKVCNEGFSDVLFSPSSHMIVTGGWDGKIRFFCARSMKILAISNVNNDTIISLSKVTLPLGISDPRRPTLKHHDLLLVASQDRTATLWSLDSIERGGGGGGAGNNF